MKVFFKIFLLAFLLNFLWENLHAPLYLHYRGGAITELVLTRAALVDALIILVLSWLSRAQKQIKRQNLLFLFLGIFAAVILEKWALATGRWAYADTMPLVSLLGVGLSPAIQLALTGYLSHRLARENKRTASAIHR